MTDEYKPTVLDQMMALEVERDVHTQREDYAKAAEVEREQFALLRRAVGLAQNPP